MFAVFFIKGGEWTMHQTFSSVASAQNEADYLMRAIGVTARVLQKVGA